MDSIAGILHCRHAVPCRGWGCVLCPMARRRVDDDGRGSAGYLDAEAVELECAFAALLHWMLLFFLQGVEWLKLEAVPTFSLAPLTVRRGAPHADDDDDGAFEVAEVSMGHEWPFGSIP